MFWGSLSALVTALQSGKHTAIGTATSGVSYCLSYVSQQRVFYGNAESQLNSQETYLQQETVSLLRSRTSLVGVDEAAAATNLNQAETDNSAALAATAKVLPTTLLNYLTPSAPARWAVELSMVMTRSMAAICAAKLSIFVS
jgi:flagellin-like hook-associated protein FlgL